METLTVLPCNCRSTISLKTSENPSKLRAFSRIASQELRVDIAEAISSQSTLSYTTVTRLIDSCVNANSLELCHEVHALAKRMMKKPDPLLETKLVGMFAKCGSLGGALSVFDEMRERDLFAWSSIIGAFSREKRWWDVMELFCWMMEDGDVIPDDFLFPKILQACGNHGDVECGRVIHGILIKLGRLNQLRVNNSLLAVYAKCGWLNSAKAFFDEMEVKDVVSWNALIKGHCQAGKTDEAHRLLELLREEGLEPDIVTWNMLISSWSQLGKCDFSIKLMKDMENNGLKPDVYTWTSLILGLVHSNRGSLAEELFREMLISGVKPNAVALMSVISACSSMKDLKKGKEVHSVGIKLGYGEEVLVGNSLIDMYSNHGQLEAASKVFHNISEKDVYSWNSMIGGYCKAGYCGIAHDLFKLMQESNVSPNVITWNTMISGYIQNGDEDQALDLFNRIEMDGGVKRDNASWNSLISGYLHHGQKDKAFRMLRQMRTSGFRPNSITILSILPACANLIAFTKLKEIHCSVLRCNLASEVPVANSLIDTYAKSGNLKYAEAIFNSMSSSDIITWNTMLNGYVLHGCYNKVIELFEGMDMRPNRSTFISILSAYGLAKMVDEGTQTFTNMVENFQIAPCLDHYAAMVNLYGRSGKLDEAFDVIAGMNIEPDVTIWSTLLTACCKHGNTRLATHACEKLLELEPENTLFRRYVLQLHGNNYESSQTRRHGSRREAMESHGCCWILNQNVVLMFTTSSLSHLEDAWVSWIEASYQKPKNINSIVDLCSRKMMMKKKSMYTVKKWR